MFHRSFLLFVILSLILFTTFAQTWKKAAWTTYTSYAACCPGNPNYDPEADRTECEDYNACKYAGQFSAIVGKRSFNWVKDNNIVSFYDDSDPDGSFFNSRYGGKQIKLRTKYREFTALIADTCGNGDCDNCCRKNSKGGFLIDMEYWTVIKNFGDLGVADGIIEFQILQEMPGTSRTHIIKDGDTLWKIAQAKGLTVDQLTSCNPGIDPTNLYIGQVIKLPGNEEL